jgi:hypothetical protein
MLSSQRVVKITLFITPMMLRTVGYLFTNSTACVGKRWMGLHSSRQSLMNPFRKTFSEVCKST